jgi:hypothetical protein
MDFVKTYNVEYHIGFSPSTTPPQLRKAIEEALAAKG